MTFGKDITLGKDRPMKFWLKEPDCEFLMFPENLQVTSEEKQLEKITEEYNEVLKAVEDKEGDLRLCEELYDLIQACEGLLRLHGAAAMDKAYQRVYDKCLWRGDYGSPEKILIDATRNCLSQADVEG